MLAHEAVRLALIVRAVVHNAQIVVDERVEEFVVAVAVEERAALFPPKIRVELFLHALGTRAPFFLFAVSEYRRNLCKRYPSVVGV